jgi:hypothetical protein
MTQDREPVDLTSAELAVSNAADIFPEPCSVTINYARMSTVKKTKFKILLALLILTGAFVLYRVKCASGVAEIESPTPIMESEADPTAKHHWITANISQASIDSAEHPLIPLLEIAERGLKKMDESYFDYTATLTNQVRYKGKLREPQCLKVKIRHPRVLEDGTKIPFSVYTRFLEPKANEGREVIWRDGWNGGNLMVHLTGWQNLVRINLEPTGSYAMEGNLYPITMIGMRNLLVQILEKGKRDLQQEKGIVNLKRGLKLNDRTVTMIESIHPNKRNHFDHHIARIYLDEEHGLPVGYEGYLWPEKEGDPPVLLEKYFYTDIELNVGLTDLDFDPSNPNYEFPK